MQMEKRMSSDRTDQQEPERFHLRPEMWPLASAAPVSLPVIDLSGSRHEVRRAVLHAGKEFGFFQVINHGMPEQTMREMEAACGDFFRMPGADKAAAFCSSSESEDDEQTSRLFSSSMYMSGNNKRCYRRDCLRLACHPVERTRPGWPDKPAGLRPALEGFIVPARSIAMELLCLLCEGVGLRPDYFEGDLTGGDIIVHVNHYPSCPEPGLTLGLPPHYDRNLITVLLQLGNVCGLQVSYGEGWIDVEPLPGALVVNFGRQLEIATNGLLQSVEHRVVANPAVARMSVAAFIMPATDCMVEPARELIGEERPTMYRSVAFYDFMRVYKTVNRHAGGER